MMDETSEKHKLERKQDRLAAWFKGFTALVVVGLVVEYLPDIIHAVRTRIFPLNISGALLITIGVAGELLIEFISSRTETRLREMNDSIIADALKRVAELNLLAEQERLARVRIEEKFKWRKLDEPQRRELTDAMKLHAGTRIDIFAFDSHITEVMILADSLSAACKTAGCKCKLVMAGAGYRMSGGSVSVGCAREATVEEQKQFSLITTAIGIVLGRAGIRISYGFGAYSKTDKLVPNAVAVFEPWDPDDVAPFRIQVVAQSLLDND